MRSRVMIGAGAWLLGVVAATAGSLLAIEQLGQGFLGQQSTELSVSSVNARLAAERGGTASPSPSVTNSGSPTAHPARASNRPKKSQRPVVHGQVVASPGGTAFAECLPAGAFLAYWTPKDGFEADNVVQGPAAVASVTFRGWGSGMVMKVSCRAGKPVANVTPVPGGGHDE